MSYAIAAGTVFRDVVVWESPSIPQAAGAGAQQAAGSRCSGSGGSSSSAWDAALVAPTALRLQGHIGSIHRQAETGAWEELLSVWEGGVHPEQLWSQPAGLQWVLAQKHWGMHLQTAAAAAVAVWITCNTCARSLHRLRWSPDGAAVASASDDRTLRLWDIPAALTATPSGTPTAAGEPAAAPGSSNHGPALLQPRHVLWGHSARLWDVAWAPGLVVSAAEDCTCRFWCRATGQLLGVVQVRRGASGRGARVVWLAVPGGWRGAFRGPAHWGNGHPMSSARCTAGGELESWAASGGSTPAALPAVIHRLTGHDPAPPRPAPPSPSPPGRATAAAASGSARCWAGCW